MKAIYPGTFDPVTHGHMEIIRRAALIFPKLIVAVAEDTTKKTLFSLNERADMLRNEVSCCPKVAKRVQVMHFAGLLVDFVAANGPAVVLRGLRAAADFEYEFQMAYMNNKIDSAVETLFMPANEASHFISSRFVKEMARLDGDVTQFVSENVAMKLRSKLLCQ